MAIRVCFVYFITIFVFLQEKKDILSQFFSYLRARNLFGGVCRKPMKEKLSISYVSSLSLLLCLFLLLVGCTKSSLPDPRKNAFSAEIVWKTPTSQFRATAEVSEDSAEDTSRDLTLTFHEPKAMKGLIVTRTNGEISLSFLNLSIESFPVKDLLRPIDLLLYDGKITATGECEIEGMRYITAKIENEKEKESYEIYLDPDNGIPKELRTDTERLRIESFDIRAP